MIRTQRHSRFVLMSLDEIRATRDIVLQTEETKSNFPDRAKRFIFAKLCALAIIKRKRTPPRTSWPQRSSG